MELVHRNVAARPFPAVLPVLPRPWVRGGGGEPGGEGRGEVGGVCGEVQGAGGGIQRWTQGDRALCVLGRIE